MPGVARASGKLPRSSVRTDGVPGIPDRRSPSALDMLLCSAYTLGTSLEYSPPASCHISSHKAVVLEEAEHTYAICSLLAALADCDCLRGHPLAFRGGARAGAPQRHAERHRQLASERNRVLIPGSTGHHPATQSDLRIRATTRNAQPGFLRDLCATRRRSGGLEHCRVRQRQRATAGGRTALRHRPLSE